MKFAFNKKEVSPADIKKVSSVLSNTKETSIVLNHANFCGHCHAMRPEFNKFKKSTSHNVIEVESDALDSFKKDQEVYKKITPGDGSMYFPMIIIFIARVNQPPKKLIYEGARTKEALSTYIKEHEEIKSKSKSPTPVKSATKSKAVKVVKPKVVKPKAEKPLKKKSIKIIKK
jgi:thiol-disulfide isomerase/thioredoxin